MDFDRTFSIELRSPWSYIWKYASSCPSCGRCTWTELCVLSHTSVTCCRNNHPVSEVPFLELFLPSSAPSRSKAELSSYYYAVWILFGGDHFKLHGLHRLPCLEGKEAKAKWVAEISIHESTFFNFARAAALCLYRWTRGINATNICTSKIKIFKTFKTWKYLEQVP